MLMYLEYSWRVCRFLIAMGDPASTPMDVHSEWLSVWLSPSDKAPKKRVSDKISFPDTLLFVTKTAINLNLRFRVPGVAKTSQGDVRWKVDLAVPDTDGATFNYNYRPVMGVDEFLDMVQFAFPSAMGKAVMQHGKQLEERMCEDAFDALPMIQTRQCVVGWRDGCLDIVNMRFFEWKHAHVVLQKGETTQVHYDMDFPFPELLKEPGSMNRFV